MFDEEANNKARYGYFANLNLRKSFDKINRSVTNVSFADDFSKLLFGDPLFPRKFLIRFDQRPAFAFPTFGLVFKILSLFQHPRFDIYDMTVQRRDRFVLQV